MHNGQVWSLLLKYFCFMFTRMIYTILKYLLMGNNSIFDSSARSITGNDQHLVTIKILKFDNDTNS